MPVGTNRAVACIALCTLIVGCKGQGDGYTLYRDSVLSADMRIHVASFDTSDGDAYNRENCDLARGLFQAQPDIKTKFWCEKGPFKK